VITVPATRATATRPTGDRSRNRRGQGRLLRTEILAAATELLDVSGDERAVTLRAVARRAGITAPSIYPHFPGQAAIVAAVVEQGFADLADQLRSATDAAGHDPGHRLQAACRAYVDFAGSHPERYRTMFGGGHRPTVDGPGAGHGDPAALGAEAMQLLTDAVTDCVAAGRSTSTNPGADASALWVGLHGLAHQRAVVASYPWPADIVHRIAAPLSHLVVT
jgi:AcrR family transcriptional regulator